MISKGAGYAEIHRHFPKVTEVDLAAFLANEDLDHTKEQTAWGKMMRDKNIGNHHLSCRGYDGKEPIWEKEDQAYRDAGIENPFDEFSHPETRKYVRSGTIKKPRAGISSRTPRWCRVFVWSRTTR